MTPWYASPYTGLFRRFGPLPTRPHDPDLRLCSGLVAPWGTHGQEQEAGGVGIDDESAEAACVGEAVERLQAYPFPDDRLLTARYADWPLDEPAVLPARWVLFSAEQHAQPGFPFATFDQQTECSWVACREAGTGEPWWVPADLVYLHSRPDTAHQLCPGLSTGLACGRAGDPLVLRGLQEVIERDAVVGAWWGRYPLEEHAADRAIDATLQECVVRPNLRYRCFRVDTPWSRHVTVVTLEGEDREGYCFSVGSACRETRAASWRKALLEAVHGRHYVRHLKRTGAGSDAPRDFAEHAVYFSRCPERLAHTAFARAVPAPPGGDAPHEGVATLAAWLGPGRPVLFRSMTPPALASQGLDWHVVRVVVPGLQPLHGSHQLPHLGGPLWSPRGLRDYDEMPPHPFP